MVSRRPLTRLIDGPSGAPGARVLRRTTFLVIPAMMVANAIGALVVFVLAWLVIPRPDIDEDVSTVLLANGIALVVYVALALAVGIRWGTRRMARTMRWLEADRPPDDQEQRRALRGTLRIIAVQGALWTTAVPVFGVLNLRFSVVLAVTVALTTLLGGLVTCAISFLILERISRSMTAVALASGVPARPVLPGVTTRAVLAWALGSGVPVVGLLLVASFELSGRDIDARQLSITIVGLGGTALLVGLALALFSARATAQPLRSVRDALERVERGELDTQVPVFDGSELGLLQAGFNRMVAGLRERERLRDLFGRHVGEDVAREAVVGEVELGGELRDVAVLFVDVVGSTTLASTRPAPEVVELLNKFFAVVVDAVSGHGGWINKFEGDAALAVFGAPVERGNPATGALAAGRELGERLRIDVPELEAAIGISAGKAVAGNVGAEQRFEYTVIGDPVNEAARLTELAKSNAARVLASEAAVASADPDEARCWHLGESVVLRGRTAATRIAEPVGAEP